MARSAAAYAVPVPGKPGSHFGGPTAIVPLLGQKGYIALTAFVLNVAVAAGLTLALRALHAPAGEDRTNPDDYTVNAGDAEVVDIPDLVDLTAL